MASETSLPQPVSSAPPRRAPGPPAAPFFGHLRAFSRDPLGFLQRNANEYGDVVRFKMWGRELYLVTHPELVREVLVVQQKSFVKGRGLDAARTLLGNGLLTSEGDFHRRQRRLAQPAFHHQRIAGYAQTMVEAAVAFQRRWEPGKPIDVNQEMMALTLEIAARTLFGTSVDADIPTISHAMTVAMESFVVGFVPLLRLMEKLPLPSTRRFFRAKADLDRIIYRIIAERRASKDDRGDLLSMLLLAQDTEEDGARMTDQQLRDEALTLFIAGHETTANALAWTWYLLAQHPEVEAKLHAELRSVLGGRPPSAEDLPQLRYTEQVFTESMRLYPPAWTIGRRALEDVTLGGYTIPAGSIVITSQWVVHRKPVYFPDPERFDPERWTPERKAALPRFAYFPFGGVSRICIGEGFAWMEGVLVLATLAQGWRMQLDPAQQVKPQPRITLRPKDGIRAALARVGAGRA